jgi:hypothetical protein
MGNLLLNSEFWGSCASKHTQRRYWLKNVNEMQWYILHAKKTSCGGGCGVPKILNFFGLVSHFSALTVIVHI